MSIVFAVIGISFTLPFGYSRFVGFFLLQDLPFALLFGQTPIYNGLVKALQSSCVFVCSVALDEQINDIEICVEGGVLALRFGRQ